MRALAQRAFAPRTFGGQALAGGGGGGGAGVACTPDLSAFTFGMQQAARAAGMVLRKTVAREGFVDASTWAPVGTAFCTGFQHVEAQVPETVIDGLLVPARVSNTFRFHSSTDVLSEDAVWMRVGNYVDTYWLVTDAPAKFTLFAGVMEVSVERFIDPPEALEAAAIGALG